MKLRITTFLLVTALLFSGITPTFSQSPEQLFQSGLVKEEGEGNLVDAIDLYSQIVENKDAEKSLRAKALLHVGICYEKLGKQEATKAYQRLVNNFPGQTNEVAIARERLSMLIPAPLSQNVAKEATPNSTTLEKVWSGAASVSGGTPSPDGRFFTYSDPETDNLAMRELSTGKTNLLTNESANNDPVQFNLGSTVAPDSKHVAYAWYKNNIEIRLINIDNPQPKVLYGNKDEDVYPCAWSPDGKTIYAKSYLNSTGQCRILAITVGSGDVQILRTFDFFHWLQLSVSPDNQYIVYDFPTVKNDELTDTDIHLISTDGKNEYTLIKHPANDKILGWFPDKNQILFKSDRSGTWDAWTVDVLNGKVAGEPRRVLTEVGKNASPMGFTDNGSFYYSLISRKFNAITAPIDQIKGELKIESYEPLLGSVRNAFWSPDGKSLALIKEDWSLSRRPLSIMDFETDKEHKVLDWLSIWHLDWSPDSK